MKIVKPTPEQEKFQALFNQTDEETIALLVKENDELYSKLEAWESCADMLFAYVMKTLHAATNIDLYEKVKEAITEYNSLKIKYES